jgi:cholesterol oxidase
MAIENGTAEGLPSSAPEQSTAPNRLNRRAVLQLTAGAAVASAGRNLTSSPPETGKLSQVLGRRRTGDSIYKSRAMSDYAHCMAEFGGGLAAPHHRLQQPQPRSTPWQFDILVVGSGYGASIAAARLAPRLSPGHRLGVLERGREWVPGSFPDRFPDVMDESRLQLLGKRKGEVNNPLGLFNVNQFDEISILSGSGLGGSSLINASVAIRTDADVFQQPIWPTAFEIVYF